MGLLRQEMQIDGDLLENTYFDIELRGLTERRLNSILTPFISAVQANAWPNSYDKQEISINNVTIIIETAMGNNGSLAAIQMIRISYVNPEGEVVNLDLDNSVKDLLAFLRRQERDRKKRQNLDKLKYAWRIGDYKGFDICSKIVDGDQIATAYLYEGEDAFKKGDIIEASLGKSKNVEEALKQARSIIDTIIKLRK